MSDTPGMIHGPLTESGRSFCESVTVHCQLSPLLGGPHVDSDVGDIVMLVT